jgi:hypothetical protein
VGRWTCVRERESGRARNVTLLPSAVNGILAIARAGYQ